MSNDHASAREQALLKHDGYTGACMDSGTMNQLLQVQNGAGAAALGSEHRLCAYSKRFSRCLRVDESTHFRGNQPGCITAADEIHAVTSNSICRICPRVCRQQGCQ